MEENESEPRYAQLLARIERAEAAIKAKQEKIDAIARRLDGLGTDRYLAGSAQSGRIYPETTAAH
ncbi:hypothetical protein ROJ8625_00138 [Roseivivax jejudonensis]|uniref:Uncharacterized protein n=1 Tax=Roseivivax jejudonensis TaxID=1529041 RepID=A0A1X6Y3K1_9RHOB|nr:hypothetical protein [Roseivivax jejudonensis]SLN09979.1 hypothetical protein ROJ8625_00138 [Roseivivax jejudonensis]